MRKRIIINFILAGSIFHTNILFSNETSITIKDKEAMQILEEEIKWLRAEAVNGFSKEDETHMRKPPSSVFLNTDDKIKHLAPGTLTDDLDALSEFNVSKDRDKTKPYMVTMQTILCHHRF